MASDPLTQAILQGLDPGIYRPLADIRQGEALQAVGQDASPTSKWGAIGRLNENFNDLGFFIIGLFVVAWGVSLLIYRLKRYDRLDAPTAPV